MFCQLFNCLDWNKSFLIFQILCRFSQAFKAVDWQTGHNAGHPELLHTECFYEAIYRVCKRWDA